MQRRKCLGIRRFWRDGLRTKIACLCSFAFFHQSLSDSRLWLTQALLFWTDGHERSLAGRCADVIAHVQAVWCRSAATWPHSNGPAHALGTHTASPLAQIATPDLAVALLLAPHSSSSIQRNGIPAPHKHGRFCTQSRSTQSQSWPWTKLQVSLLFLLS